MLGLLLVLERLRDLAQPAVEAGVELFDASIPSRRFGLDWLWCAM